MAAKMFLLFSGQRRSDVANLWWAISTFLAWLHRLTCLSSSFLQICRKVVALVAAPPAMSHHRSFAPEVSAEEQQRAQAEAARKLSFTKSREESSRLACERDVARAKQRGSRVFPIAATEALCARLVKRQCQC